MMLALSAGRYLLRLIQLDLCKSYILNFVFYDRECKGYWDEDNIPGAEVTGTEAIKTS